MSGKNRKAEEEDRKMLTAMIGWMQSSDSAEDRERGRLNAEQRNSLMRERLARLGATPAAAIETMTLTNLFYDHATTLHVETALGKTGSQPKASGSRQSGASALDENNNEKADDEQTEASGSSAANQK